MGLESLIGGEGFLTTTVNGLVNWGRKNALWPMPRPLAYGPGREDTGRLEKEVLGAEAAIPGKLRQAQ